MARVLHFDPFSGISGDMTLAALLDAGVPPQPVLDGIGSLGLPIKVKIAKVRKGGFAATQIFVDAPEEDEERHLPEVEDILSRGQLTSGQRDLALKIFRRLAAAEAAAHGMPLEKVHFHEVGALDSLADIAGSAIALDLLNVVRCTSGPVPTGSGTVQCAHGLMPIPAPGTAALLKGVPLRPSTIKSELTTPTGAAILTSVVDDWIEQPVMVIEQIGHGAGSKDFLEQPNLLRVFVGETSEPRPSGSGPGLECDAVWLLETNLDDASGEVIGYCFERLFAAGALDVWTTPIQMKKNRPGVLFSVLVETLNLAAAEAILFQETGTLGVRRQLLTRHKLPRRETTAPTPWGPVRGKVASRGASEEFSPEYEDCARIARENQVPLSAVMTAAARAFSDQAKDAQP